MPRAAPAAGSRRGSGGKYGANTTFIEVGGKMLKTGVRFRDNAQLLNICQRIVSLDGRG